MVGADVRSGVSYVRQILLEGDVVADLDLRRVVCKVQVIADFVLRLLDRDEVGRAAGTGSLSDKVHRPWRCGVKGLAVRVRLRLPGEHQVQAERCIAFVTPSW